MESFNLLLEERSNELADVLDGDLLGGREVVTTVIRKIDDDEHGSVLELDEATDLGGDVAVDVSVEVSELVVLALLEGDAAGLGHDLDVLGLVLGGDGVAIGEEDEAGTVVDAIGLGVEVVDGLGDPREGLDGVGVAENGSALSGHEVSVGVEEEESGVAIDVVLQGDLLDGVALEAEGEPWHGLVVLVVLLLDSIAGAEDDLEVLTLLLQEVVVLLEDGGELSAGAAPVGAVVEAEDLTLEGFGVDGTLLAGEGAGADLIDGGLLPGEGVGGGLDHGLGVGVDDVALRIEHDDGGNAVDVVDGLEVGAEGGLAEGDGEPGHDLEVLVKAGLVVVLGAPDDLDVLLGLDLVVELGELGGELSAGAAPVSTKAGRGEEANTRSRGRRTCPRGRRSGRSRRGRGGTHRKFQRKPLL